MYVTYVLNVVIGVYGILVAIFGTIGNLLSMAVCLRKELRKVPTFVFMIFMLLADCFGLYFWNLSDFFITFYTKTLGDYDIHWCKLSAFGQMYSLQVSAVFLVVISIERYLSVKIKSWRVKFTVKHTIIVGFCTATFFFALNSHLLVLLNFDATNGTAALGSCGASPVNKLWRSVHTYIYSFGPFLVLLIVNCLLLKETISSQKRIGQERSTNTKHRAMSVSVLSLTFLFIMLTAPFAIVGSFFQPLLMFSESGRVIMYTCMEISFTFHGSNFIILYASNKRFSKEFKAMCNGFKNFGNKTAATTVETTQTIACRKNNIKSNEI